MINNVKKRLNLEKISICMIYVYICSLCISRWNAAYSISLSFLVLLFFLLYYKKKIGYVVFPDIKFNLLYWPFFICIFVSSIFLGDLESIGQSINYLYWSMPFFIMLFSCKYNLRNEYIILAISTSIIVLSGYALIQFIATPVLRVSGLFGHPNHFATVMSLNLTYLISLSTQAKSYKRLLKCIIAFSICVGILALTLSGSRGSFLGVISAGIITFILHCTTVHVSVKEKIKVAMIFVGLLLTFIGGIYFIGNQKVSNSYDNERIKLLLSSYEMWNEHKVLGVGLTNWSEEYQEKYIRHDAKEPDLNIPHNVLAYFFSTTGILGGIGYLLYTFGICGYMYKELRKTPQNMFILAFLWSSLSITIHGLVDVGIMLNNAFKLYSGFLGITMASIVCHSDDKDA